MTVTSLWKTLDRSGCGISVGSVAMSTGKLCGNLETEFMSISGANHNTPTQRIAVDLSIWICEAFTSYGIQDNNSNPFLHLVFSRTIKLLEMGIKLVFVVEGKSRIRDLSVGTTCSFRKRRRGTDFWKACEACKKMLVHFGVLVVTAYAEGEALCALLNQRGIVDAVISNDGDCLLYGAKTVYTRFSNANLDDGKVIRYDHDRLLANIDSHDNEDMENSEKGKVQLSRYDLISFALLTGSDVVGSGLQKVGSKKAIRFIRKCQLDFPLSIETASLDELRNWIKNATVCQPCLESSEILEKNTKCSRCNHAGSKRNHEKHGCTKCGTQPGEICFIMTIEDRFRKDLRDKVLTMPQLFDLEKILNIYMTPNENKLPLDIVQTKNSWKSSSWQALIDFPMIIKGHCYQSSRAYVKSAVSKLLAKQTIKDGLLSEFPSVQQDMHIQSHKPEPVQINRTYFKDKIQYYEIKWKMNATVTDSNGNNIDEYEFMTMEKEDHISKAFPELVHTFQESCKRTVPKADDQQLCRQSFLENLVPDVTNDNNLLLKRKVGCLGKRKGFFEAKVCTDSYRQHDAPQHALPPSDDIVNLLRFVAKPIWCSPAKSVPHPASSLDPQQSICPHNLFCMALDEIGCELMCTMGGCKILMTPMKSNEGHYPPHHIFVHK